MLDIKAMTQNMKGQTLEEIIKQAYIAGMSDMLELTHDRAVKVQTNKLSGKSTYLKAVGTKELTRIKDELEYHLNN